MTRKYRPGRGIASICPAGPTGPRSRFDEEGLRVERWEELSKVFTEFTEYTIPLNKT